MRLIEFHVIKVDTLFLLSLADMNRLKVYFNNVENLLINTIKILSIIRRFDHDFLLWKNSHSLHSYIIQSFNSNFCYLTVVELRQLHRRFEHSSAKPETAGKITFWLTGLTLADGADIGWRGWHWLRKITFG